MNKQFYRLTCPYAGVQVKHDKKAYILDAGAKEPVIIVKPNTLLIELDNTPILTPDKQPVKPTGKFYMTAETIEPYHIVLDITRLGTVTYART